MFTAETYSTIVCLCILVIAFNKLASHFKPENEEAYQAPLFVEVKLSERRYRFIKVTLICFILFILFGFFAAIKYHQSI